MLTQKLKLWAKRSGYQINLQNPNQHKQGSGLLPSIAVHTRRSVTLLIKMAHLTKGAISEIYSTAKSQDYIQKTSDFKKHTDSKQTTLLHKKKKKIGLEGVFKSHHLKCKCCIDICHNTKTLKSTQMGEVFPIKHHLTCHSSYVIYLIHCRCGLQYVGHTTQQLHNRLNKHRANIKNKFNLHQCLHAVHQSILERYPHIDDADRSYQLHST